MTVQRIESGVCGELALASFDVNQRKFVPTPCKNKATYMVDGRPMCGKHYNAVERREFRRTALTAIVESKWPRMQGAITCRQQLDELVNLLLPLVKAGVL